MEHFALEVLYPANIVWPTSRFNQTAHAAQNDLCLDDLRLRVDSCFAFLFHDLLTILG
jgi:hypothetical protein